MLIYVVICALGVCRYAVRGERQWCKCGRGVLMIVGFWGGGVGCVVGLWGGVWGRGVGRLVSCRLEDVWRGVYLHILRCTVNET